MSIKNLEYRISELVKQNKDKISIYLLTNEGKIGFDEFKQLKSASVIKLPILIEAFRQDELGKLDLNKQININNNQKVRGTGVLNYLSGANTYSLLDLLKLMIIVSDNTAANIAIEEIGVDSIADLSKLIGIKTELKRKFMDINSMNSGIENKTSAFDMVHYLKIVGESNDIISDDSREKILNILSNQQFKQKLPAYNNNHVDSNLYFYNKTGEYRGVEHDVCIIKNDEKTIYVAVLSEGWSYNLQGQTILASIGECIVDYMNQNKMNDIK